MTLDHAVARRGGRTVAIIAAVLAVLAAAGIVVASSGGPRARVAGPVGQAGAIVAIDPATDRVVADLPIGRSPSDVATGGGSIWVLDANDQTISQIDPRNRSVAQTFGAGAAPTRLAFGNGSEDVSPGNPALQGLPMGRENGQASAPVQDELPQRLFERLVGEQLLGFPNGHDGTDQMLPLLGSDATVHLLAGP